MSEPNLSLEEHLFEVALGKSSEAERAAFLDGVCRGNPVLRARLDVLLEAQFQAEGFLNCRPSKINQTPAHLPQKTKRPPLSSGVTNCWKKSVKEALARFG